LANHFHSFTVIFMQTVKDALDKHEPVKAVPTISAVFKDGGILEMLHDPEVCETSFGYWHNGSWRFVNEHPLNAVYKLVPYSPTNNLIQNETVLLPQAPEEYGSEADLIARIKAFIHRYVDVSPLYEQIASYYVLFSWIYDGFNELPYLRVRGDFGTGKSRFLLSVGSLCYKPIFASGASTVSPVFRLLESFRGTLVIDESDFRFSDEKAEMVKILNNGNTRGFPVLRSDTNNQGEFNPHAYHVFGPKIVATRGDFEDKALESRFLSEEMGNTLLREDIPINLPPEHKTEALALRNKLLLFGFRNLNQRPILTNLVDRSLEPRLNQILVPLMSIVTDPKAQADVRAVGRQCQREMIAERGQGTEAQVLEVIQDLLVLNGEGPFRVKDITDRFTELFGDEYKFTIRAKWIGGIIRNRLHLKTYRTGGGYVIPDTERPRREQLFQKYGLNQTARHEADARIASDTDTQLPS